MIEEIDLHLNQWINSIIDNHFKISFEHPGKIDNTPTVSIYLYNIGNQPPTSVAREIPFQITLSYILTVHSDKPIDSHKTLAKLLFSANERPDFEVKYSSLPIEYWLSFGIATLPYFILCLPLIKIKDKKPIPLVRQPVQVDISSMTRLSGIVIDSNKKPIPAAKLTAAQSTSFVYTNDRGYFTLAIHPKNSRTFNCKIDVKGKEYLISVPIEDGPITIHLDTIEV